jgi:molybdate transport system permease protein
VPAWPAFAKGPDVLSAEALSALALSLKVAAVAMVIALPLALFAGYALARWRFPGKALVTVLIYLPLVLPPVVTGYLLLILFGPNGVIGRWLEQGLGLVLAFRWTGAALAAGVMAFPLLVRPIALAFAAVDKRLEDAADTLGAKPATVFFTLTLPLAAPGIFAGVALGFAKALGEFGATITFAANIPGETRTLALAVHTALQRPDGDMLAIGLSMIALSVGALAVGLSEFAASRIRLDRHA